MAATTGRHEHAPTSEARLGTTTSSGSSNGSSHDRDAEHHNGKTSSAESFRARILLADDDPDMRKMVTRALRRSGYQVVEVTDGNELLDHLNAGSATGAYDEPDLVISDIRMPGRSGIEVLEGLRSANWVMPVILITAFGDKATHDESHRLGAAMILDKPFEIDELMHAVRAVVPPRI